MKNDGAQPIGVGLYEDHNAGIAAVQGGEIILYSELERHTRRKNQSGWRPDLVAGLLETLPLDQIGAFSCPRPDVIRDFLCSRFGGRKRPDGRVDLGGEPVRLLSQDDLHPQLHFLSTLVLPDMQPAVYIVIVFDAAQPQVGWVDLREPLRALPGLSLTVQGGRPWFVGDIFASLFGKIFYGEEAGLESCGKLMGLSSWGRVCVRRVEALRNLAQDHFDDSALIWQGYERVEPKRLREEVQAIFNIDPRRHDDSRTLDLAAAAQELFRHELIVQVERGVARAMADLSERGLPKPRAVLYSGGCAMSVLTNEAIRKAIGLPVIVPPFSHDAGQFVGGAVHAALCADPTPMPLGCGWPKLPCHTSGRITAAELGAAGLPFLPVTPPEVAERIGRGQLIGCLAGGAEAGPRALGNRSLLANALDPAVRGRLNHEVKRREWYRPFAPMLAAEDFPAYFDTPATPGARYMLDSFSIQPALRAHLSAVSSPDGISRAQAVDESVSPWVYDLLRELGRRTGHPIVLNTSLNGPSLPIAHGLDQALDDCHVLGLDAVVFRGDADGSDALLLDLKQ